MTDDGYSEGRVLAVCVGRAAPLRTLTGTVVPSAIIKHPVQGAVAVGNLGIEGDEQADLNLHGGPDQAVYAYPAEHYALWTHELGSDLQAPDFGENLSIHGLHETVVRIGDIYKISDAILQVTSPRTPCYKLAARHALKDLPARMITATRAGFYLRVLRPGHIAHSERMTLVERAENSLTVQRVMQLGYARPMEPHAVEEALANPALGARWRAALTKRLAKRLAKHPADRPNTIALRAVIKDCRLADCWTLLGLSAPPRG